MERASSLPSFPIFPPSYTKPIQPEKFAKVWHRADTDDEHSWGRFLQTSRFPGGETVRRRPSNGLPGLLHFLTRRTPHAPREAGSHNLTRSVRSTDR